MTDDEFRRHVFRTLGAIQRDQETICAEQRRQRYAWGVVILGLVAILAAVLFMC